MLSRRQLLVSGCLLAMPPLRGASAQPQELNVKLVRGGDTLSFLPVLYADGAGLFKTNGINITWLPHTLSSTNQAALVRTGQADFAVSTPAAALTSQATGQDVVAFAILGKGGFNQIILTNKARETVKGVAADAPLRNKVQALKGMKIATYPVGTVADAILRHLLKDNGINPDADVVLVPNSDMTASVAAARIGRVEAYFSAPPFSSLSLADGSGQLWIDFTRGDVPGIAASPLTAMIVRRNSLTEKAEETSRIVRTLAQGFEAVNSEPQKVKQIVKPKYFEKIDDKVFDLAFETSLGLFKHDMTASQAGFDQLAKTVTVVDVRGNPVSLSFDQVFDFSAVKKNSRRT